MLAAQRAWKKGQAGPIGAGSNGQADGAPASTATRSPNRGRPVLFGCLGIVGVLVLLTVIGAVSGGGKNASAPNVATPERPEAAVASLADTPVKDAPTQTAAIEAAAPAESSLTGPQNNAVRTALQYLDLTGFSRKGLIQQLSADAGSGYDVTDATIAVDSLNVDWDSQAVRSAKQYLELTGFSCKGLIEQLSSSAGSKYTTSQATYGAKQAGAC